MNDDPMTLVDEIPTAKGKRARELEKQLTTEIVNQIKTLPEYWRDPQLGSAAVRYLSDDQLVDLCLTPVTTGHHAEKVRYFYAKRVVDELVRRNCPIGEQTWRAIGERWPRWIAENREAPTAAVIGAVRSFDHYSDSKSRKSLIAILSHPNYPGEERSADDIFDI